jgi:hypothetical protein
MISTNSAVNRAVLVSEIKVSDVELLDTVKGRVGWCSGFKEANRRILLTYVCVAGKQGKAGSIFIFGEVLAAS